MAQGDYEDRCDEPEPRAYYMVNLDKNPNEIVGDFAEVYLDSLAGRDWEEVKEYWMDKAPYRVQKVLKFMLFITSMRCAVGNLCEIPPGVVVTEIIATRVQFGRLKHDVKLM